MKEHGSLFFFTPLIAAMAGNVGVQSSAIIVQGLATVSYTHLDVYKRQVE